MPNFKQILEFLGIQYTISIDIFETQRVVKRGKKEILQRLTESNYAQSSHWEDVKIIEP